MIRRALSRFLRNDHGAALVEFALSLPLVLVVFATIIEGGRMMWAYQTAAAGVRDAARYLARVAPSDICTTGTAISTYATGLDAIVRDSIDGDTLLPSGITVVSVTPGLDCVEGDFRVSPAPVASVTVVLRVTFPFGAIFDFAGDGITGFDATITDENRVFGA